MAQQGEEEKQGKESGDRVCEKVGEIIGSSKSCWAGGDVGLHKELH